MRFGLPPDIDLDEAVVVQAPRWEPLSAAEQFERLSSVTGSSNRWDPPHDAGFDADVVPQKPLNALRAYPAINPEATVRSAVDALTRRFEAGLRIQQQQVRVLLEEEQKMKDERAKRLAEEQKKREEDVRREKERAEREKREKERIEAEKRAADEAEKKRLAEEEQKRQLEEEQKKLQNARLGKGMYNTSAISDEFTGWKQVIADIKVTIVEPLEQNSNLKKATGALRRKINPKLGQLSNSKSHVTTLTSQVVEIIQSAQQVGELPYRWLLNFVAKAVVDQAETEVTVKQTAALPLAMFVELILSAFPDFEQLLMARFVKKCPFIIGYTDSIGTEEGRKRMGWRRSEGKWEDESKYDERVAGICTVWAVIAANPNVRADSFSSSRLWQFLSRMANRNKDSLTNAHFACVANWWEASAGAFLQVYSDQAHKLLRLAAMDWTEMVADKKYPSAARLRILGDEWLQTGKLEYIKPMEP